MRIYWAHQTEEVQVCPALIKKWSQTQHCDGQDLLTYLFCLSVYIKGLTERETPLYKMQLYLSSVSISDVLYSNCLLSLPLFAHVDLAFTSLPVLSFIATACTTPYRYSSTVKQQLDSVQQQHHEQNFSYGCRDSLCISLSSFGLFQTF